MTNQEFKDKLWEAANALRGSVTAAQYKYPVLGLIFLKYVSDMFEAQADVIKQRLSDPKSDFFIDDEDLRRESEVIFINDKTFYESDNVFWVPQGIRFQELLGKAADADFPQQLDQAMATLEAENPSLKGILYRDFGRLELEEGKLGDLMAIVAKIHFDPKTHGSRDIFGEVYEYFLGKFARQEGARAGEFYTPKSVVTLLVEVLAPYRGTIYDPACGSGGMFVQSARFKDAHAKKVGKKGDLPIYGQELMAATRKLCKMNLAVHGLEGDLGKSYGSTFTNDQHHTLRADYVLANPPFNISDWGGEKLLEDPRWVFGIPPVNNANYAWLEHIASRLSHRGRAGIVLASTSMNSRQNTELKIRKSMLENDVVECMIALPDKLFSNTKITACLWFLSKDKGSADGKIKRNGEVLFLDCRKLGEFIEESRTQLEFTDSDIRLVAQAYHRWRETEFSDGESYENVPGFCYSAKLSEIEEKNYVLDPGRYVGAAETSEEEGDLCAEVKNVADEIDLQISQLEEMNAELSKPVIGTGYIEKQLSILRTHIKTVEKASALVFKSWFIDFDFADACQDCGTLTVEGVEECKSYFSEFQDSEIGQVPVGWRVMSMDEILTEKKDKVGSRNVEEYSCTNLGLIPRAEKFTAQLSKSIEKNKFIKKGDLVFGLSRRILNFGLMKEDSGAVSPAYKIYTVDSSVVWPEYIETYMRLMPNVFEKIISAGAREGQSISVHALLESKIPIPPENVQKSFHRYLNSLLMSIDAKI